MSETHRKQVEVLPRYTEFGYLLLKIPPEIKGPLVREYFSKRSSSSHETDAAMVEFSSEDSRPRMTWITGSSSELILRAWLKEALSKWIGDASELEHTSTYGVRSYLRGSKLTPHTDRYMTHVISAIIQIDRVNMKEDWPLHVLPHRSPQVSSISLSEGENDCLFYESCTVPHGRLTPLDADEYSNLFVHFMPRDWKDEAHKLMK